MVWKQGRVVTACVNSVEEHGYTVDLGVEGVSGFLSNSDAQPLLNHVSPLARPAWVIIFFGKSRLVLNCSSSLLIFFFVFLFFWAQLSQKRLVKGQPLQCLVQSAGKRASRTATIVVDPELVARSLFTHKLVEMQTLSAGQRVNLQVAAQSAEGLIGTFWGLTVRWPRAAG